MNSPTRAAIRRGAGLAAVLLIAAGCAGAAPATSTLEDTAQPQRAPLMLAGHPMESCVLGGTMASCGTLSVLEDRSNTAGRRIDLRVAVLPASGASVEPDPVVFLTGGPGGAATLEYAWTASVYAELNRTRDFILVDQRGTGGSNRLVIPDGPDTAGLSPSEADAVASSWLAKLLAEMPGDPRFYTTSVAMDDIDEVRAALGYERINIVGGSYGATAAQYYLRQHEDRVRSVVLDGGTLVDVPIFELVARNSQRALDIMFDRCAADAACHAAFPAIRTEFAAIMARLATDPVTSAVDHPWTGQPIVIDAATFAGAVHNALMRDEYTARLPFLIHAAFMGNVDLIASGVAAALGPKSSDTGQLAMSAVIRCSEAWARYDPAETSRASAGSYLRGVQVAGAETLAGICHYAPKGVVPANDAEPARSDVPTLLILGGADPQNPPANVADAPNELPNSRTVIVPDEGHTVGSRGCMPSVVTSFIQAGTTAGLDVSCAATSVPLPSFEVAR